MLNYQMCKQYFIINVFRVCLANNFNYTQLYYIVFRCFLKKILNLLSLKAKPLLDT